MLALVVSSILHACHQIFGHSFPTIRMKSSELWAGARVRPLQRNHL